MAPKEEFPAGDGITIANDEAVELVEADVLAEPTLQSKLVSVELLNKNFPVRNLGAVPLQPAI